MKVLSSIPILAILLSINACSNQESANPEIPIIEIGDLWNSETYLKLSEVAESIEYIALEKTDNCILPGENQLSCIIIGDFILVRPYKNPILVFNHDGKYQFTLGKKGKGPGDYISGKIQYDEINEVFWILDGVLKKLLKFNNKGKLIDELKIEDGISNYCLLDTSLYLLKFIYENNGIDSEVLKLNTEGTICKRIPLYGEREPGVGDFSAIMNFFGISNGKLCFNEPPFRHGYVLNENDQWEETWTLNQGDQAVKSEDYYPSSSTKGEVWNKTAIMQMIETPNFIFMGGMSNRDSKAFVFNKSTNTTKANHIFAETKNTRDMHGLFNDFDGGLPFWPGGSAGNNTYVQINDASRYIDLNLGFLKYYNVNDAVPVSPKLKAFCETLEEEDNPVVMVVKLK